MKRFIVVSLFVSLIFIVCLSCAVSSPLAAPDEGQGRCVAAVARVQRAVTAEAHAFADARRTLCQYMSLSPEMRQGKPQAINDSMQRKLPAAKEETTAAYNAARGCDTSRVKRPEVSNYSPETEVRMNICYSRHGLDWPIPISGDVSACDKLREELNCNAIKVVDDAPPQEEEPVAPGDLKPECRDTYLQYKAAERDYERAQKRVQDLAPKFGTAGPRGTAMYNAAREDMLRADKNQLHAKQNLDKCSGYGEAPAQTSAPQFALTRVGEPKGDPPCSTWGNINSCNPEGASIAWGTINYQWTAPPPQIGPEGISINLSVSESNRPDNASATGLKIRASGFDVSGGSPDVAVGGRGQALSGSTNVMLKPRPGAGEYSIRIGVYWGPGYIYTYRAEAATNTQPKRDDSTSSRTSPVTATVHWFRGDVSMRSRGGSFVDLSTMGTQLSEGDDISTGVNGEAMLAFSDGSTVNLLPNTQCNIGSLLRQRGDVRVRVNLKIGQVAARVAKSETSNPSFEVRTPNATASVRGTVFNVRYDDQSQTTTVAVEKGTVDVASNNSSGVAVSAGQQVQVAQNGVGRVVAINEATTMEPKYLGCYKDTSALDLNGWLERSRSNTPQSCIANCRDRGFKYAAVQYGESCLCGNSYGKYGPATNCDYKCTGDPNQICGGYSTNSVYQIR